MSGSTFFDDSSNLVMLFVTGYGSQDEVEMNDTALVLIEPYYSFRRGYSNLQVDPESDGVVCAHDGTRSAPSISPL